jgi:hypothetical protein
MADDLVPYAYEYGKSNGDGTYSVVIERPPLRSQVAYRPAKPLYTAGLIEQQAASLAAKDKEIEMLRASELAKENARLKQWIDLHRGDTMSLSNEVETFRSEMIAAEARAEQAERALAEAVEVMRPFAEGLIEVSGLAIIVRAPTARGARTAARAFVAQHGSDSKGE